MIIRSWFLLFFLTLASTVYSRFIVFRQNGDQRVSPATEEFDSAQKILVKYQFPLYVYDPAISAADKDELDKNEVGFLQQKIQAEVAQDLYVSAVSPTLYDLVILRIKLTAMLVEKIIAKVDQVNPVLAIKTDKNENSCVQPYARKVIMAGIHRPKELTRLLDAPEGGQQHVCFSKQDFLDLYNLMNVPVFDGVDYANLHSNGSLFTNVDIKKFKDNFKVKYAAFLVANSAFQKVNTPVERASIGSLMSIPLSRPVLGNILLGNRLPFTDDGIKKLLSRRFRHYVIQCSLNAQSEACAHAEYFVNLFLLTQNCSPEYLLNDCIQLMRVLQDYQGCTCLSQGQEFVLRAIEIEQSDLNTSFVYRGTDNCPASEWLTPLPLSSLPFGKTLISGFITDIDNEDLSKEPEFDNDVVLPIVILKNYGYALSINHAQYRHDFENGDNMLFVPPLTMTIDFFGRGEVYSPRSRIRKCLLPDLLDISQVAGMSVSAAHKFAYFYMTCWDKYQDYQRESASLVERIIMLKGGPGAA